MLSNRWLCCTHEWDESGNRGRGGSHSLREVKDDDEDDEGCESADFECGKGKVVKWIDGFLWMKLRGRPVKSGSGIHVHETSIRKKTDTCKILQSSPKSSITILSNDIMHITRNLPNHNRIDVYRL